VPRPLWVHTWTRLAPRRGEPGHLAEHGILALPQAGQAAKDARRGGQTIGPQTARKINTLLKEAYPSVFGGAVMRNFFGSQSSPQAAEVEVYLFTSAR
jgi:hypothetical protein